MKKLLLLALTTCLLLPLTAQELTVYGEGTMPTGNYGKSSFTPIAGTDIHRLQSAITDTGNALGGASFGWGIGVQYAIPFATPGKGLELVMDAGFRLTWLNGDVRQYFDEYAERHNSQGVTDRPIYYNIPLMVGPRLTIQLDKDFALFANVMAGVDFRIISDAIYTADYSYDYHTAYPLSFRVAAGVLLFQHLRLEANWSWLGDEPVVATLYDNGVFHPSSTLGTLETTQLALRVGWTF